MSIWKTTSIIETPEIELAQWRVMEVTSPYWDGTSRHFIGYNITENEGRVSSQIVEFDSNTMQGITSSGRIYKLVGNAGYDSDAGYVWSRWKSLNSVEEEKDVSDELCKGD